MSSARSAWPIRGFRLGEEPPDDLTGLTTAEDRLRMMWRMAREGWALAGRSLPSSLRSETPSRLFRPGEPPGEE